MHDFHYVGQELYCEDRSISSLAAEFGTPLYVYSQQTFTRHYQALDQAMAGVDHAVSYSVKSNSNLAVLRLLRDLGSGFDIVSEGELQRVIAAGGSPSDCLFAGVGKTANEIEFALKRGIYCFNVESEPELDRINRIAGQLGVTAPVAVRVNPNVEAKTHAKITTGTYENKFGIAFEEVEAVYQRAGALEHLKPIGIQMHIGSQLTQVEPFEKAVRKVAPLIEKLAQQYPFEFFSIGGGLGIIYQPALESGASEWWESEKARDLLTPQRYAESLAPLLKPLGLRIFLEPGRFIAGNAGVLVTRVEYVKQTGDKNFVIVDAAMNDLIRPAFYEAYHEIVPIHAKSEGITSSDVVGPVCESGDAFCQDRPLPAMQEGDFLGLMSAGAYSMVMASNYNSRGFPAEVLVNGSQAEVVRARQPLEQLLQGERVPSWMT